MSVPEPQQLLNLDQVKIDPAWALRIPAALALRRKVLPLAAIDDHVVVACGEPDAAALQAVQRYVRMPVTPRRAEPASLERALQRVFGRAPASLTNAAAAPRRPGELSAAEAEAETAVGLCDELLYAALLRQASDIHLDPDEEGCEVRFRVDGVLERYRRLPVDTVQAVTGRFKVLAGMDIAEKRAPQDGRFRHSAGGNVELDIRTASLPTRYGERLTLRLLMLNARELTLEKLGMAPRDRMTFEHAIDKPHGLILLTGPTGSGKTTTLYAAIRRLISRENLNVITIEDPVEYEIPGVAQVEVDTADKVSFGKALRSVLRHDPDVLMIGEIRDGETADVAIKSALTGHLVFSTLHTNSAASVVTRLCDMGVERYLVAATLRLAVAQRLVRLLCSHCRRPRPLTERDAVALHAPDLAGQLIYEPAGCMYCANRGFVGRVGLFESLPITEELSRQIAHGAEEPDLIAEMRRQGFYQLFDDAREKLLAGETTLGEVLSAVTQW